MKTKTRLVPLAREFVKASTRQNLNELFQQAMIPASLTIWSINGPAINRNLACIFHEGGCISHVFVTRINLTGRLLGIGAQAQFVPIHFQEKCAVTV